MPAADAHAVWDRLLAAGVAPCGLGARDTLRLEAAMNLYGTDMDETVSPLEAGLEWTVAWEPADRDFIGRAQSRRYGTLRTDNASLVCYLKTKVCFAIIRKSSSMA